ncbi:MAG TPA: orotate phosphoribosyltransferase [Planctomycetes bacterium]|nr:orotate phosphoribosyltransferase [Planctomycetaceae bacterium]HIN95837.1 orotate phosphoribosyltransferase [Planctomycetota bacterium]
MQLCANGIEVIPIAPTQDVTHPSPQLLTEWRFLVFDREALIELMREKKALEFGNFTLASGKQASFYLDCRKITLDSKGVNLVAAGMLDKLGDDLPDAVGGMAIGADPITAAVIMLSGQQNRPLKGFIVRKEAKAHGKGQAVEGPVQPGERVVILEDVVTTGGSSLQAIEQAEAFGLQVEGIIAIIDRLEGGAQAFQQRGYQLESLLTVRDFGIDPEAD